MPSVEELLAGRSDLSTFLVHFTRAQSGATGRDVLLKILSERLLKASNVHGIAKSLVESDTVPLDVRDDVRNRLAVVCMSEVPVDYWSMLCTDIPGRSWRFAPYGLVFTKDWARSWSFNPVWYLNTVMGSTWLTTPFNELMEAAHSGRAFRKNEQGNWEQVGFRESQIARVLPYIETAGVGKDFSWEREWRRVGSLSFIPRDTVAVLAPEADHATFQKDYDDMSATSGAPPTPLNLVDPSWPVSSLREAVINQEAV